MDDSVTAEKLRRLIDRQEITDCLHRYCRGLDRFDRELARSAFHPDAQDDHVGYIGGAHGLVDWANEFHPTVWAALQHHVTNMSIELDGDTAHTETYFILTARSHAYEPFLSGGRYVDRFERRDGEWRIAARICITEWILDPAEAARTIPVSFQSTWDDRDVSYMRPLKVERAPRVLYGPGAAGEDAAGFFPDRRRDAEASA